MKNQSKKQRKQSGNMVDNIGYGLLAVGLLLMGLTTLEGLSVLIMAFGMVLVIQQWL